jgi:hypothetical protein
MVATIVDDLQRGRVASVSDAGEVELEMPDGLRRIVHIPIETVRLVRRLAALEAELAADRRRRSA